MNTNLKTVSNYSIFHQPVCTAPDDVTDNEYVLRPPYKPKFRPDRALREKIAKYFKSIYGGMEGLIRGKLPDIMPLWGKMRIIDGGDAFRSVKAAGKRLNERNISFARVSHRISSICDVLNPATV